MHICPPSHCGEYYDGETKTYYLRARYYDPNIGRFTQQDTHWSTANSIYGDNPQKINEREDKLGLKSYSYAPQITAVMQSGNLYVYGVNNPVAYVDRDGNLALEILALILLGGLAVLGTAALSKAFQTLRKSLGDVLTSLAQQMSANITTAKKRSAEHTEKDYDIAQFKFYLPSLKKIKIDMDHILSGHSAGGNRGGPNKTRFPKGMTATLIKKAIEEAYKNADKAGKLQRTWTDGVEMIRQLFKGHWQGGDIYFWYNYTTRTIETAWPG